MKLKKLMTITTIILGIGGLIMFFTLNGDNKLSQEEQRNRQYEVSLVKALKNSYRDIEEIRISSPEYSDKPGSWSCYVELLFSDGIKINYVLNHNLGYSINRSAITSSKDSKKLMMHYGRTSTDIKVTYSNGDEEISN